MSLQEATAQPGSLVHLRGGGVSLLLDARGPGMPVVLHWGEDLGDGAPVGWSAPVWAPAVPNNAVDVPVPLGLLPEEALGWSGRAGLSGHRDGHDWSPSFRVVDLHRVDDGVELTVEDPVAALTVTSELRLDGTGVLRLRHRVRNDGAASYALDRLALVLPVPGRATEVLDLTGRWCREAHPQRRDLQQGAWVRESRHGRTGHDASLVLAVGTPGFGWRHGEVWAVHLGWSGNHTAWVERGADGRGVLAVGELLGPGEVILAPGEGYATPWAYATWSDRGLDGLSGSYHRYVRSRPGHPRTPRPVVLNTWEAVYFAHDLDSLTGLADVAADLGVERFVLDDGWFGGRRHDRAGLGDWTVSGEVWPQGLTPLITHVTGLGMGFGLWVEPEMVNPDSDLYRAHPEWVLRERPGGPLPPPSRNQQVLDLGQPAAWEHILGRLDALLSDDDISYLKWDHNRDLVAAGHDGRPGVHGQTLAVYRLLDELRRRHPGVEIESCSSGGARVDLGILERTDRIWSSDCNDALERQTIQRWQGLLLPPELIGAHIGPPTAHTTGRTHPLNFRAVTALFGHLGLEWDVRQAGEAERHVLREVIAFHQRHRALLHGGTAVRTDAIDTTHQVHGVVGDGEAVFAYVQLSSAPTEVPAPVRLPGLDDDRAYRVVVEDVAGAALAVQRVPPPWTTEPGGVVLTGRQLRITGLPVPVLVPEQALLLHLSPA